MNLIKKILKISNTKADEILNNASNVHNSKPLISDENFMDSYKTSNERIQKLRESIQNTKL